MGKDQGSFLRICVFAIGHVTFDLITVITVNHLDVWSPTVNLMCHFVFYLFALLFSYEFFCYTVALCLTKRTLKIVRWLGIVPLAIYLLIFPFLPMTYVHGNGTNYSFGAAAIVGYGVAMLFFVASIFVVIIYHKNIDKYVMAALLPMLGSAIAAEAAQIAIPELLFTGGAVTIITVGFFFSLENPVAVLRHKVLIDSMTGVKSRHSYDVEIKEMDKKFASGTQYGMVFCDINDLKVVNDTRGHMEGDSYIASIAQILMNSFKSAEAIYRMGGDEFLAIYQNKSIDIIRREVASAEKACEQQSVSHDYPMSMAIGYAMSDKSYDSLSEVLNTADYRMYSDKTKIKLKRTYFIGDEDDINISGLTDRVFDAYASTDSNRFLFVTNMVTNVTRWSHSAVEYFAIGSEFIRDCADVILKRVHPEDSDAFFNDITAIMTGKQQNLDIEFRILNGSGNYVACSCCGKVLKGKKQEPDLFAGTMYIRGAEESIDHVTDIRNGYEMMNYFDYLVHSKTPAAVLKVSITNLKRINMLYGYACGNEILRQFAVIVHNAAGSNSNVFRSEGTKFVVCVPGMKKTELVDVYSRIRTSAEQMVRLESLTPPLQLAAGAYMLPENFSGTGSVLRSNLIYAHTKSKYQNHGRLVFCDDLSAGDTNMERNKLLLSIHRDAIADYNGFYLVYQPIVSNQTGRIVGAEALLRWSDNTFGEVFPDRFIPWLEGDPCFCGLGEWILKTALVEANRIRQYQNDFTINVNIAMPQLEDENFKSIVIGNA